MQTLNISVKLQPDIVSVCKLGTMRCGLLELLNLHIHLELDGAAPTAAAWLADLFMHWCFANEHNHAMLFREESCTAAIADRLAHILARTKFV